MRRARQGQGALYARSRRSGSALLVLTAANAVGLIVIASSRLARDTPIMSALLPLVTAIVVATSVATPMPELEGTASRRLWVIRIGHFAVLLGCALALTWPVASFATGSVMAPGWTRNLIGCLGLALLSARFIGTGLCWIVPTMLTFASLISGPARGSTRFWAFPILTDRSLVGWLLALAAFAAGVITLMSAAPDARRNIG
jgi:hypothetical protein